MAADTVYKVGAEFALRTGRARQEARSLRNEVRELGQRITGSRSAAGGLVRQLVGIGAAYLGVRAGIRIFANLTRGAEQYQRELQGTKIGLAAVLQAVEGGSFESAANKASVVFNQLRTDAVKSVATTQEMFSIYQSILGPIRAAGFGLEKVRDLTNETVAASTALGVDLPQATRDIGLMVRGQAGMDTRLFAILRSTGAIAETTETWNKNLTQTERVNKLSAALSKFTPAADAYARSWAGVTSTFQDIREQLMAALTGPLFERMGKRLERLNDYVLANWDHLQARAEMMGVKIADAFDRVFGVAERAFVGIAQNWDKIAIRIEQAAKVAGHAALLYGAGQVAGSVVGAAGAISTFTGAGAVGAAGTAAAAAPAFMGMRPELTAASMAAAGGGGGGAAGAASGLAGVLGPLAAALGMVAGAVGVVRENWDAFIRIFESSTGGMLAQLTGLLSEMWRAFAPIFKMISQGLLAVLVPVLGLLVAVLRQVIEGWRLIFQVLGDGTRWIYDTFRPSWEEFWSWMADTFEGFFGTTLQASQAWAEQQRQITRAQENAIEDLKKQLGIGAKTPDASPGDMFDWSRARIAPKTPQGRVTQVNDFRGSKIEVKQDFRDADPDRVLVQMIQGITRQAELRIQSGFAPALSR